MPWRLPSEEVETDTFFPNRPGLTLQLLHGYCQILLGPGKVIGKRNKARTLYVDNGALYWLNDWLAVCGMRMGCCVLIVARLPYDGERTITAIGIGAWR